MGTTAEKLQNIINAKTDIGAAITEKGGTVPPKLIDYGKAIRALPAGAPARQIQAGKDWLQVKNPPTVSIEFEGLAYGEGVFVAVDQDGAIWRTTDGGETWIGPYYISGTPYVESYFGIAYGSGAFVAGNVNNAEPVRSSDKGITWSPVDGDSMSAYEKIAYGDGVFIAVDSLSYMSRSVDGGQTWDYIDHKSSAYSWTNIVYGGGVFLAIGRKNPNDTGCLAYSTDKGATWTEVALKAGTEYIAGCYGAGIFLVSPSMSSQNVLTISRSADMCKTWSEIEIPWNSNEKVYSIVYGDGIFVIFPFSTSTAKNPTHIAYSEDNGLTWKKVQIPYAQIYTGAAYGGGIFVGLGLQEAFRSFTGLTDQEVVSTAEEGF